MQSLEDRQKYVKDTHLLTTDLFMKLIEQGKLPLRPGVQRIISKCRPSYSIQRLTLHARPKLILVDVTANHREQYGPAYPCETWLLQSTAC